MTKSCYFHENYGDPGSHWHDEFHLAFMHWFLIVLACGGARVSWWRVAEDTQVIS